MILFTSDTHWNHKRIIQFCERPYEDVEQMNRALIDNWNAVVGEDDDVYHLGDFAFAKASKVEAIVAQLNGRIHMVWGNHDEEDVRALDCWASKQSYAEVRIDGDLVCLSHYAMRSWNGSHRGSYMLFGHTHNNLDPINRSIDVGVDSFGYKPVTFTEVRARLGELKLDEVPVLLPRTEKGAWQKS